MPTYQYRCDGCENSFEAFRTMKDESPEKCPKCTGTETTRVPCVPNTDMREFQVPIDLHSIGMTSLEQVLEFKRKCPDVECSDDMSHPNFGLPIARTRKQKLAAYKAVGFVETK